MTLLVIVFNQQLLTTVRPFHFVFFISLASTGLNHFFSLLLRHLHIFMGGPCCFVDLLNYLDVTEIRFYQ